MIRALHLTPAAALVATLAAGVFLAAPASASTALKMDIEALTVGADAIVLGTVSKTEARFDESRKRIYTTVEITVEEGLLGAAAGTTVTIRQPGGVVDGLGQVVHGAAEFQTGQRTVVFLERARLKSGARPFMVRGMAQGQLLLKQDAALGTVAVQRLEGLALAERRADGSVAPLPLSAVTPVTLPLTELRSRISAALEQRRPGK